MFKFVSGYSCKTVTDGGISETSSDSFLLSACHNCFHHIFYTRIPGNFLDYKNDSQMENACSMRKDSTISVDSCLKRVRSCCQEAEKCCIKQLSQKDERSMTVCPMTWDGISCVDETPTNHTIRVICPTFIHNFLGHKAAEKQCLENGTWLTVTRANVTWQPTDYSKCTALLIENEYLLSQIKVSILSLSLIMLFASLCVFISFKSLRSQQRIKIHINLFLTLFLKSSFELMNTVLIGMNIYNRLTSSTSQSGTILQENKEACKWITILLRYFQNSTFCWMLCEAVFLYQLLFRTFKPLSSIKMYLLIGWAIPSIYTLIYFFIRRFHPNFQNMDRHCWVEELPKMEYLMRGPNMIVMLVNIILLINILYFIRNLPTQPSDRSYWRRTLKAVLILVPLFGLHFILVAFQIETENPFYFEYSLIQNVVQSSQGVAVSLAFCAMNQEVFDIVKQKVDLSGCNSHWLIPRNNVLKRYSNSSRGSDHSRLIGSVHFHLPMTVQRPTINHITSENLNNIITCR